jgi:hypothetical protein
MKTISRLFFILTIIITTSLLTPVQADPPGMPGAHGETGDQAPPGGGAPIASGLAILIGLGGAYASKKFYNLSK